MSTPSPASIPFEQLFVRHGAASFDKQIYLQAMLGKSGWSFSLDEGILAFRLPHETLQLSVQLLGSESTAAQTWLWSWANTDSVIPAPLLAAADQLRSLGQTDQIPEFTTEVLSLSPDVNGSRIAAIATGVARAACYFRVAYPGGVLYMLIKDARYKRSVRHPLQRIARIFPLFAPEIRVKKQREAYLHYLTFYRLVIRQEENRIFACSAPLSAEPTAVPAESFDPLQLNAAQPNCLVADIDEAGQVNILPLSA